MINLHEHARGRRRSHWLEELGIAHQQFPAASSSVRREALADGDALPLSVFFFRQGPQTTTALGSCSCHCGIMKNIFALPLLAQSS